MDGENPTIDPRKLLLPPVASRAQGNELNSSVADFVFDPPSQDYGAVDTTLDRNADNSLSAVIRNEQLAKCYAWLEDGLPHFAPSSLAPIGILWHPTALPDHFPDFSSTDDGTIPADLVTVSAGAGLPTQPIRICDETSSLVGINRFLPILDGGWSAGAQNSDSLQTDDYLAAHGDVLGQYGNDRPGHAVPIMGGQQLSWLPLLDGPQAQAGPSSSFCQHQTTLSIPFGNSDMMAFGPQYPLTGEEEAWEMDIDFSKLSQRRVSEPSVSILSTDRLIPPPPTHHRRYSDKLHERLTLKPSLTFVIESGGKRNKHQSLSRIKGRRSGPLPTAVRENAKKVRQEKSICIRCKKDRQPCSRNNDEPCTYCISMGLTAKWSQPCTKASFLDIIESGTCNYISQRAVNHLTADGTRRIRIDLPETLDLEAMLNTLEQCRHSFDIRARQTSGSLYILSLDKCYDYLSSIRRKSSDSTYDLRKFIDSDILKTRSWQECVYDCKPLENLMACLSIWGNMPSRASYSFIQHDDSSNSATDSEIDMDVNDPDDREVIIMAAQLSRIVCRKLEVDAYSHLQQALNQWSKIGPSELSTLVRDFGRVLLTLRWRVSWWTLLGDGGSTPDDKGREAFAHRVHQLCRVLYFYYCMLRNKLPQWHSKKDLHGVWSTYPDTTLPVFEWFPIEASIEGFEAWMMKGQELIATADVAGKLANIGLRKGQKV